MSENQTRFQNFLAEEIRKYKGVYVPVKAGFLQRALIRKARPKHLHPNPDDEFCQPKIGPNYEIISHYERNIRNAKFHAQVRLFDEPLAVEKIRPDGYMILNGHHRWAAALRYRLRRVPIRIVNLTQETDVQRMLEKAKYQQRVTLDLDEVVFQTDSGGPAEKALFFPWRFVYKERLRLGIPALFRFCNTRGYDVWVYSANYYSMDYIRELFKLYHVRVTGIVTGTARKAPENTKTGEKLENRMAEKYAVTVHIDQGSVVRIDSRTKEFSEFKLDGPASGWSAEVMDIIQSWSSSKSS